MHPIIVTLKYTLFTVGIPARFDIYQDLSMLGFWILIVAGLSLLVAGAYHMMKPFSFFNASPANDDWVDEDGEDRLSDIPIPAIHRFIQNSPFPVAVFDRNLQFVTASKLWLALFGLIGKQVTGKSFYEVFPGSRPGWGEIHQRCLEGKNEKLEHDVFVYPDGKSEWIGFDIHPWLLDADRVGGLIMYAESTTDRLKTETTLERARELVEEASRTKSDFISNISHELCTPLTSILGYAQMFEVDSELSRGQLNQIREIRKSGDHLLSIIRDIIEFAKLGTHKVSFSADSIDVIQLIEEVVRVKKAKYRKGKIDVDIQIDPGIPVSLISDRQKLRRIMDNLVDNAFKFITEGDITIIASLEDGGEAGANRMLSITVGDTGRGIPSSELENIFTPFSQLHQQFIEGTGMGLSLSKGLAEFLGGTLEVESEYDMGSVFMLNIPVRVPERTLRTVHKKETLSSETPNIPEYTPKEVSDFIKSLGAPSSDIIQEALGLKDVSFIVNLERILELPENKSDGVLGRLKQSAQDKDFCFMAEVNSELKKIAE